MAVVTLLLDAVPPANPSIVIEDGAPVTASRTVLVALATPDFSDGAPALEMKVWGDVDPLADTNVQATDLDSAWIPFVTTKQVVLSTGSGTKRLWLVVRDTVGNETVPVSDAIALDLTLPVVSITSGISRSRISKVAGFDVAQFSWQASQDFTDYEVRVVPNRASIYGTGVAMKSQGGSTNVKGSGTFAHDTPITTTITGLDLEATSPGSTAKTIKVFVKDQATGQWSV